MCSGTSACRNLPTYPLAAHLLTEFGRAALLAPIPTFMIYYTVQQTPGMLAVQQSIGDSIVVVVLGLLVAFLNKSPEAAAASVETDSSADMD